MPRRPLAGRAESFGAYGKLPLVGDFIRRGLPAAVVAGLDDWLQARLSETPPAWPDGALGSWRFLITPGVIAPDALIGIITPSRDRIGRLFPFLIASQIAPVCSDLYEVDDAWLGRAERMVEMIRNADGGVEVLDQGLKALAAHGRSADRVTPFSVQGGASLWWRDAAYDQVQTVATLPDREIFASMMTSWNDVQGERDALIPEAATSPDVKGYLL